MENTTNHINNLDNYANLISIVDFENFNDCFVILLENILLNMLKYSDCGHGGSSSITLAQDV